MSVRAPLHTPSYYTGLIYTPFLFLETTKTKITMTFKFMGTTAEEWTYDGGELTRDPLQRYVIKKFVTT